MLFAFNTYEQLFLPVQGHHYWRLKAGKSCILLRLVQDKFKADYEKTNGVQFGSKILDLPKYPIRLQIWDASGQPAFKSFTKAYIKSSIGVILVYDIANRDSFSNIEKWLSDAKQLANSNATMFLVGNKSDLQYNRSVSYDEGFNLAKHNGMLFTQCSANAGQNIETIFHQISQAIVDKIQRKEIDPKNQANGIKLGSFKSQVTEKYA